LNPWGFLFVGGCVDFCMSEKEKIKKTQEFMGDDNLEDGVHTSYYENGQKYHEWTTKNGEWDGLITMWYENGQKGSETIFKNNYEVFSKTWNRDGSLKDGVHTIYFDDNKNKMVEENYKDGKPHGTHTHWFDENQKYNERNYKDGKPHGTHIRWYKNGQKESEEIFKDGELIFEKEWNKDGSVKE